MRSQLFPFFALTAILLVFPFSIAASETVGDLQKSVYYVSPDGDDANPGSETAPWKTPEHAGEMAGPGDTVVFAAGIYPGRLIPQNSGTPENPIVFRAAESRQARLIGEQAGNWAQGETARILLRDVSHVTVEGFHVEDTGQAGWLQVMDSSHLTIRDCRFTGGRRWAAFRISGSEQISVLDNDFSRRARSGDMLHVSASRQLLFEGNSFSRSLHSLLMLHLPAGGSRQIVFRGNVFHSGWSRNLENVGHPDVLVENNIFTNALSGGHSAGSVNQFDGLRTIVRFNQVFRNFGAPWQTAASSTRPNEHARYYHNVFHGNHGVGLIVMGTSANFSDFVLKNSIFQANDPHGSQTQLSMTGDSAKSIRVANNAFFAGKTNAPSLFLLGHSPLNLRDAERNREDDGESLYTDNLETDAGFAAAERFDFSLTETSPLRDAAAPLTATRADGQGRELPVEDSFYFYDGYGIDGETGDLIAVGKTENRARITRIDHDSRTLFLDRELRWQAGDPVAFPWAGDGPDLGVYEHGEDVRPSVQILVSHPFPKPGDEVELRAVLRGIDSPVQYDWQFGDNSRAQGERVRHRFEPGFDYGIRVRVTDADGRTHLGVGYVNAESPPSDDVLIHTTFDADDETWWANWRFYRGRRGTGYANYRHILDRETGNGFQHISTRDGTGPLPAIFHAKGWDLEKYPTVRIRYRIRPGTPIAIFVSPYPSAHHVPELWDFRMDDRRHYLAGTETEPRGDQRLIDDGEWHEITLDVSGIATEFPGVRMIQAFHMGDLEDYGGRSVRAEDEFWLDEIYIGK